MKKSAIIILTLFSSAIASINAQTVSIGMFSPGRIFTSTANYSDTSLRLVGGSMALGTFAGGFSYDFAGKTRGQLFTDFSILSGSSILGTIGNNSTVAFSPGRFSVSGISSSLAINTPLFALITTGADLTSGNFAYIGGNNASDSPQWLAPDPTNPLASTSIGVQALNNRVWAGQAEFQNGGSIATAAGNLAIIPEPSTYALMAFGGLVLFFIARRRKAQA